MFFEKEHLFSNKQKYKIIWRNTEKIIRKIFEVLEVEIYEWTIFLWRIQKGMFKKCIY